MEMLTKGMVPLLNAFRSAIEISSHLETSRLADRRLPVLR